MCIAYISIGQPDWPLLIAANRDEFHARPTRPLAVWPDNSSIIAGLDEQAGGTWLGWAVGNRYAFLTNYREINYKKSINQPSRGKLVSDYLNSDLTPAEYAKNIVNNIHEWAGFNLVIGDLHESWYLSNRNFDDELNAKTFAKYYLSQNANHDQSFENIALKLKPGTYVISNHLLDTPWPKSQLLRTKLDQITPAQWLAKPGLVFDCLYNTDKASIDDLPQTGIEQSFELLLSSPFIISNEYGTRSSSLLAINTDGHGLFSELSFNAAGEPTERNDWPLQ